MGSPIWFLKTKLMIWVSSSSECAASSFFMASCFDNFAVCYVSSKSRIPLLGLALLMSSISESMSKSIESGSKDVWEIFS